MNIARTVTKSEVELFRVLEHGNLLQYFSSFVAQGGDDVNQLSNAAEEEFQEILSLVGMASKPLHIRRFRKSIADWKQNPEQFQQPLPLGTTLPHFTKNNIFSKAGNNSNTSQNSATPSTQSGQPAFMLSLPPFAPLSGAPGTGSNIISIPTATPQVASSTTPDDSLSRKQSNKTVEGIPVSLLANATLTEDQKKQIEISAEELIKALPDYPVKEANPKLPVHRSIQKLLTSSQDTPNRSSEIYRYAAIYGRFDAPRRTGKPMSIHEVSVNEAAGQLAIRMPSLLTRREDLFPLARQVVKMADGTINKLSAKARRRKAIRTQQVASATNQTSSSSDISLSLRDGNLGDGENQSLLPLDLPNDREGALDQLTNLQTKMNAGKYDISGLIVKHEQLRHAFRNAKQANMSTLMAEIQKQIDTVSATQQLKLEEQAMMVVHQRKLLSMINKSPKASRLNDNIKNDNRHQRECETSQSGGVKQEHQDSAIHQSINQLPVNMNQQNRTLNISNPNSTLVFQPQYQFHQIHQNQPNQTQLKVQEQHYNLQQTFPITIQNSGVVTTCNPAFTSSLYRPSQSPMQQNIQMSGDSNNYTDNNNSSCKIETVFPTSNYQNPYNIPLGITSTISHNANLIPSLPRSL